MLSCLRDKVRTFDYDNYSMNFLNPSAFWFLGFIVIPITIHFLNKFKVKKVNFSTIKFIKELEYLSLYVHNVLPINYQEQGIHPNDPSISMYSTFFSKNDPVSTARKKWHDFIHKDYDFFWNVLSNHIDYRTLTDQEIVNLQDVHEIIYFINPDGINTVLNDHKTNSILNFLYSKYIKIRNWTSCS